MASRHAHTLTHEQARRVYDRIGSRQDSQAFYEDVATAIVIKHGEFERARRVLEFGCGTGRFAAELLSQHLSEDSRYRGLDLSPAMVSLARARLEMFGDRAEVVLTDGDQPAAEPAGAYDRFVSNYVLDLLSEADISAVIGEAHRVLEPGGLLCLCGLSTGSGPLSSLLSRAWATVHAIRPSLVGGCRPLDLLDWIDEPRWRVRHRARVAPYGVSSEVVVAERAG